MLTQTVLYCICSVWCGIHTKWPTAGERERNVQPCSLIHFWSLSFVGWHPNFVKFLVNLTISFLGYSRSFIIRVFVINLEHIKFVRTMHTAGIPLCLMSDMTILFFIIAAYRFVWWEKLSVVIANYGLKAHMGAFVTENSAYYSAKSVHPPSHPWTTPATHLFMDTHTWTHTHTHRRTDTPARGRRADGIDFKPNSAKYGNRVYAMNSFGALPKRRQQTPSSMARKHTERHM